MKKSLTKLLARMAKDGDAETVAEFIEEMIAEKEEAPADVLPEAAEAAAPDEPVTIEVPENREVTVDSDVLTGILERLDQLIALLTLPEPVARDGDLAEEEAEVVEEVLETAGNEGAADPAAEAAGLVENLPEPAVSTTLEENEDACGDPDPADARDTLRAVLKAVRPALAKMTPSQRRKVCGDIAANLRGRKTADSRVYASLASARKPSRDLASLGEKIMASRNPCYRKGV